MTLPSEQKSRALDMELLIRYALRKGLITRDDETQVRNALLDLLQIDEPLDEEQETETERLHGFDSVSSIDEILERLCDYAAEVGLIPENTAAYRDLFDTRVMGLLTPRPSEVAAKFAFSSLKGCQGRD